MVIRRGEVYWCDLDPVRGHEQGERRPVVVISVDSYNGTKTPLIAVVPLTRSAAKTPVHVRFTGAETGLSVDSTALTDHLRFLDKTRLDAVPAGALHPDAMSRLDRNLSRILGLG